MLRAASRRSKYSTAFPKEGCLAPRDPSRESAAPRGDFHRNSCNKIRKWILQLLDEKYRRRLQYAAYYSGYYAKKSLGFRSIHYAKCKPPAPSRGWRIDTQLVELARLMRRTRSLIGNVQVDILHPRGSIASHQLGKFRPSLLPDL